MSTAIAKNLQVGSDSTATNNFTIFQPATPDGTLRIGNGNTGITASLLSLSSTGNLSFTGTGQRITGDFSNATVANRVMFQTSTVNGNSAISVIPNGTGTAGQVQGFSNSDPTNASRFNLAAIAGVDVRLDSNITGTGTYLPMTFYTGGSERVRVDTAGNVGVGTSSPGAKLHVFGVNTTSNNYTNGDATGAALLLQDTGGLAGNGGQILFAASQGIFAGIKGLITNGTGPAGDLVFQTRALTGNVNERVRIDYLGNVGIGTSSPYSKLDVYSTIVDPTLGEATGVGSIRITNGATALSSAGGLEFKIAGDTNGYGAKIQTLNSGGPQLVFANRVANATWVERMRIDNNGNVGIGTNSPQSKLHVVGSVRLGASGGEGGEVSFDNVSGTGTGTFLDVDGGNNFRIYNAQNTSTVFYTAAAERARIDASGNLLVGTTNASGRLTVIGANASSIPLGIDTNATYAQIQSYSSSPLMLNPLGNEVRVGGITDQGAYFLQVNGSGVWGAGAYVNGSDARLKENVQTLTDGLSVITQLRPVTFQYKADYSKDTAVQPGFIAQELQQAMAGKDYVDGVVHAGPEYLNVAYQSLIPVLVKAVQELKAMNDTLTARVAQLEAK